MKRWRVTLRRAGSSASRATISICSASRWASRCPTPKWRGIPTTFRPSPLRLGRMKVADGDWRASPGMDLAAKGQDLLLQTLALPEWWDRPVELNLYGAGGHEPALRRLARMLQVKNVHFRGHVNNVRAIWEQNHLLVLPSRYEGLPLALVEAMWCGRPVGGDGCWRERGVVRG